MAHTFPGGLVNHDHFPFFSWLVPAVSLNQGVSGFQIESWHFTNLRNFPEIFGVPFSLGDQNDGMVWKVKKWEMSGMGHQNELQDNFLELGQFFQSPE